MAISQVLVSVLTSNIGHKVVWHSLAEACAIEHVKVATSSLPMLQQETVESTERAESSHSIVVTTRVDTWVLVMLGAQVGK